MQKRMLLLLFIMGSLNVCAMEKEPSNSFFPFCLSLPTWFEDNLVSLSPMQRVQADKDKFEEQLLLSFSSRDMVLYGLLMARGWWTAENIDSKPTDFLKYCYNLDLYSYPAGFMTLVDLDKNNSLRDKCKQARIDGYSALGAAIIAGSVMYKDEQVKDMFIVKLKKMGFEFTQKDKHLLALEIYNNIPDEQKQSAILLMQMYKKTEGNFSVLPQDLMVSIVAHIVVFVLRASINTVEFADLWV